MADHRRFELFAKWIIAELPSARRVYDVAGGMGKLNEALTARGVQCVTYDRRHKHLDVAFIEREFTLDEPCAADAVVGMHADGATRLIIEYCALHRIPFAVVPCCSDNSLPYRPWMKYLAELASSLGMETRLDDLPMEGRARVLFGTVKSNAG